MSATVHPFDPNAPYQLSKAEKQRAYDVAAAYYPLRPALDDLFEACQRDDAKARAFWAEVVDLHTMWSAQERRAA